MTFCHFDVTVTSIVNCSINLISESKILLSIKFELDQVIILKVIQVSLFFHPKKCFNPLKTKGCNSNTLQQWLLTKYENNPERYRIKVKRFFSISYGVLELWRKNPKGADSVPLPQDYTGSGIPLSVSAEVISNFSILISPTQNSFNPIQAFFGEGGALLCQNGLQ